MDDIEINTMNLTLCKNYIFKVKLINYIMQKILAY